MNTNDRLTRPPRPLTPELLKSLRDTPRLTFHKSLILGIADPVPNPSPMSETDGEWVRHNVWPSWMRTIDDPYPCGFWRWTNCERGRCWNCIGNRCDLCIHRQQQGPDIDRSPDLIRAQDGRPIAPLLRPDNNPECVWMCRCECPTPSENVTTECDSGKVKAPKPRPAPAGMDPLFDLEHP
ncbi:DUF6248 family natural product biosynthesis protein [Nocardiopsis alba]|uniref:DUF6248 family natural product biosynthesis protein n=1 Tax=Nocardiopsis alba TaxID=53437 RepID=UPI0033BF0D1C